MPLLQSRMLAIALLFAALTVAPAIAYAGATPCRGDCNSDRFFDGTDLQLLIAAVFGNPTACPGADANDDDSASAADIVRLVATITSPDCAAPQPPTPTPTATATAAATPASSWITLPRLPAGPRQEHAVAALDGKVYVIGGFVSSPFPIQTDLVEVYDTTTQSWGTAAPLPIDLHHVAVATTGGKIYAIGGLDGPQFVPVRNVYEYDPNDNRWTRRADLPVARGAGAAAVRAGIIHFVGGSIPADPSSPRHDAYDPQTNRWTELAPLPSGRDHLGAVVIGGMLYAVGGRNRLVNTAELNRYDPSNDRWEVLAPMPTARGGIAVAAVNERLVVIGGEFFFPTQGVFPQVEIYNPATNQWTSLAPMPVPRHGMGAATVGDRIYVPGGGTRAGFGATAIADALRIELSP